MTDAEQCGQCGYDLVGIAIQGRCPECGQAYDLDSGQGTTARQTPWLQKHIRTVALVGFAVVVLGCSGLLSISSSNPLALVMTGLVLSGVVVLGAMVSYHAERQDDRDAGE